MDIGLSRPADPDDGVRIKRDISRRRLRMAGAALVALLGVFVGVRWLYWQITHVVLDDARIAADMVVLSSRMPGWVRDLPVVAGQKLARGDLLVQVDARDAALAVAELDARIAGIAARRAELAARYAMVDRQTESEHAAATARLDAARAALPAAEADRVFTEAELARAGRLIASGATTRQRVEQLNAALDSARQRVIAAAADIRNAEALMAAALAGREELEVIARQRDALGPQERELTAARDRAALERADRTIRMPFDGVVGRIFVEAGEYVQAGQRIILVHDPAQVRVEANAKETDIRFFRLGVPVRVTVDAYPGRVFDGVVDRITPATTSEFALLPSPNPSGNFTKITQRVPIRIVLQPPPPPGLLSPGMMVRVEAEARAEEHE